MGFWNEYRDSVFDVPPLPPPGGATATPGAGGSGPAPVGTPKAEERNDRQAAIHGMSVDKMQVALRAGAITEAEVAETWGPTKLAEIKASPWTAQNDKDLANAKALFAGLPTPMSFTNTTSPGPEGQMSAGAFNWAPAAGQEGQPSAAAGFNPSSASGASRGATGTSAGGGASGKSGGGGSGSPSASAAPSPPIMPNSAAYFAQLSRPGKTVPNNGGTIISGGQQYRNPGSPVQIAEGQWQNVGPDGQPTGAIFKTSTAANYAKAYIDAGPGVVSRMGNSPTARAAGNGGYQNVIPEASRLFNTIGIDESIAAGATRGGQPGDILGTSLQRGQPAMDIMYGGVPEGGGLQVSGNYMAPFEVMTGQLADGTSIGQSSLLGNSGFNTIHFLAQSTGIPESYLASMKLTAPQVIQMQQAADDLRSKGLMPPLSSFYATYEPGGGLTSEPRNGGWGGNTPYDKAITGFLNYADVKNSDLTYLPEPSGYGSTQVGNVAYGSNLLMDPNYYGGM